MYTAAILTGGRATRCGGRDKSALVVDGHTVLDRQLAELSRVADDILIVGAGTAPSPGKNVRFVHDLVPGCGPLGGLHTALTEARGDATIVLACDMPYVSGPFLAYLAGLTRDADAVVPRTEHGYHPLCAAYTRACLEPIARRLTEGRLKVTDLFGDVRLRVVTAEEIDRFGNRHWLLANVNTPAEYRSLDALRSHEL